MACKRSRNKKEAQRHDILKCWNSLKFSDIHVLDHGYGWRYGDDAYRDNRGGRDRSGGFQFQRMSIAEVGTARASSSPGESWEYYLH